MLLLCSLNGIAQETITVSGSVVDDTNDEALIGVSILLGGTLQGTTSDINGKFSLADIPVGSTLQFSYVGYESKEVIFETSEFREIRLAQNLQVLEQVLVVGYGKQEKKVSTGAISRVSAENIEGIKVANVQSALEGQVTGLIVNESSGQPGACLLYTSDAADE